MGIWFPLFPRVISRCSPSWDAIARWKFDSLPHPYAVFPYCGMWSHDRDLITHSFPQQMMPYLIPLFFLHICSIVQDADTVHQPHYIKSSPRAIRVSTHPTQRRSPSPVVLHDHSRQGSQRMLIIHCAIVWYDCNISCVVLLLQLYSVMIIDKVHK